MRTIMVCVLALTALTGCAPEVRQEVARERALDQLHADALRVAVVSLCR